ncbi:hypothetical protein EDD21DRAFT_383154 [Dissophora ornata]|nr:hypothetical protein EDD21DRAFT_388592 [Dissophora ornata]KAI8598208.1 hypothetical protein EDD21DRAFT_383154 [Dissophora ornata]
MRRPSHKIHVGSRLRTLACLLAVTLAATLSPAVLQELDETLGYLAEREKLKKTTPLLVSAASFADELYSDSQEDDGGVAPDPGEDKPSITQEPAKGTTCQLTAIPKRLVNEEVVNSAREFTKSGILPFTGGLLRISSTRASRAGR